MAPKPSSDRWTVLLGGGIGNMMPAVALPDAETDLLGLRVGYCKKSKERKRKMATEPNVPVFKMCNLFVSEPTPMPSSRKIGRISSSMSQLQNEYSLCSLLIGCMK